MNEMSTLVNELTEELTAILVNTGVSLRLAKLGSAWVFVIGDLITLSITRDVEKTTTYQVGYTVNKVQKTVAELRMDAIKKSHNNIKPECTYANMYVGNYGIGGNVTHSWCIPKPVEPPKDYININGGANGQGNIQILTTK